MRELTEEEIQNLICNYEKQHGIKIKTWQTAGAQSMYTFVNIRSGHHHTMLMNWEGIMKAVHRHMAFQLVLGEVPLNKINGHKKDKE